MKKIIIISFIVFSCIAAGADYGEGFIFGERILSIMQKSVPEGERDIVRRQIALLYAQTENEDEGIAALMTIKSESEFIPAAMAFTNVMSETYRFNSAEKTADLLKEEYRTEAYIVAAEDMVTAGITEDCAALLKKAEMSVSEDFEPYKKAKYLSKLSALHFRLKNTPKALELVSKALWEAQTIKDADKKAFALKDVSLSYISMGNRIITGFVEGQIGQNRNPMILMEIAKDYLDAGEKSGAAKFMKSAKKNAVKEADLKIKSSILHDAAIIYRDMGDNKLSLECAKLSLESARRIPSRMDRIRAMLAANDIFMNDSVYAIALEEMAMVKDYRERMRLVTSIASGYMKMNMREKGFFLLKMIAGEARKNKRSADTEGILESISDIYIEYGSQSECGEFIKNLKLNFPEHPLIISKMYLANNNYQNAKKYADMIKSWKKRSLQRIKITEMAFRSGDKGISNDALNSMLDEISLSEDAVMKCILLSDLAILCVKNSVHLEGKSLSKLEKI